MPVETGSSTNPPAARVDSASATPSTAAGPPVPEDKKSNNNSENPPLHNFAKSESKSLGFTGRVKDMFSGKKAVSTAMAVGFLFTWSERVLAYFRTGFSLYRDTPRMVTGRNLGGQGRLGVLKTAGGNLKNLFVPGSDNNFVSKYTIGEKLEASAMVIGFAQQIWFLLSSREGEIPEGDTFLEKAKNVLKDWKRHAAQMTAMWMGVVMEILAAGRILTGIRNLSYDSQGNKIGFHPAMAIEGQDRIAKIETLMPLISGIAIAIYAPLTIYGILKIPKAKKEATPSEETTLAEETEGDIVVSDNQTSSKDLKPFAKSQSKVQSQPKAEKEKEGGFKEIIAMFTPTNLKEIIKYAKENDPIGIIGRTLGFGLDIGSFAVGYARLKQIESGNYAHKFGTAGSSEWTRARANAVQTRNVGILGFALTALYNTYVYDTIMHAHKREEAALKTGPNEQLAR